MDGVTGTGRGGATPAAARGGRHALRRILARRRAGCWLPWRLLPRQRTASRTAAFRLQAAAPRAASTAIGRVRRPVQGASVDHVGFRSGIQAPPARTGAAAGLS
ncbi:hypothetical protein [Burkholderia gladioli]|uniref:hypothetical protein n=1 Tax=Burkholderia gladioli TaxID=28095 RepID=UPI0019175062|nr:hypothetical protein [Burkholderia gladioli]